MHEIWRHAWRATYKKTPGRFYIDRVLTFERLAAGTGAELLQACQNFILYMVGHLGVAVRLHGVVGAALRK